MSQYRWQDELRVPETLTEQLRAFRRRVWAIKISESLAIAAVSVFVAFFGVFALDRIVDSSPWLRSCVAFAALIGVCTIPWFLYRWVWQFHRFEQLARLLSRKMPRTGDQLLGIIELAQNRWEQSRSRTLCQAAIEQVSEDAQHCDFRVATPDTRLKPMLTVGVTLLFAIALMAKLIPGATENAWARLSRPWVETPRYTFAAVNELPTKLVVAHGEPFNVTAKLADGSLWHPATATAQLGNQPPVTAELSGNAYTFQFPPQIDSGTLRLRFGDATPRIEIEPQLRPELTSIIAKIHLPDYLGRPTVLEKDVRGGALSLVKGSRVSFVPTVNRALRSATANDKACAPAGPSFATSELSITDTQQLKLAWQDEFGLACKEPFKIAIAAQADEPPQLACEDLPRNRVVLDTEELVFHVRASDDFGVQNVGIAWKGMPSDMVDKPAAGNKMLAVGGHDKETLDVQGTFNAKSLGIEPQPIELRIFATDYFPGRKPVNTAPYVLYVLNAEQHAIWITEQLAKWHRQSLEVRDRELQLFEENKKLRSMTAEELDRPETRRRIERQADAEQVNGRRLANLTEVGKDLLRQAARNPEIGVGHLDKWAEMLQILADISANRMPSVAGLLKNASKAPRVAASTKPANSGPAVGQSRAQSAAKPGANNPQPAKNSNAVPRVVDSESSQQPPDPLAGSPPKNGKPSTPTLRLPVTTLVGKATPRPNAEDQPAPETLDQAVNQQRDLLAEFEKVADELNTVLANLEGSTLVKRLKAVSRQQYSIAGRISDGIEKSFGVAELVSVAQQGQPPRMIRNVGGYVQENEPKKKPALLAGEVGDALTKLSNQEDDSLQKVSYIMDDMAAYFERRRMVRFKSVLDDMRKQDVLGGLRQLTDDIPHEQGLSIAQCEFWSDSMDRWAEDLVDPACSGACPGCRSKGSLPPSIVLEVLQILEGEINLREETRVAEQAKAAVDAQKHVAESERLGQSQNALEDRVTKVVARIRELPDGDADFAKEIALLGQVASVMKDAGNILVKSETGPPAIACETEAIELLLKSKRINPNSGGGGGANPGGGGTGNTQDSALALLGAGLNQKEVREHQGTQQSVGETGPVWPEEFRAGLDQYFGRLESKQD